MDRYPYILGCLLGTALGDAVGLRREGLSRQRATQMYGGTPLQPDLFFARGFCSDDTEHTQMVGRALALSAGNVGEFERELSSQLQRWFLALPAGIGFATLRACLKLLLGFGPARSGVHSAGNGPAMRSALIGVCVEPDSQLQEFVRRSTRITHTDPKAEEGALLVARAAGLRVRASDAEPIEFFSRAAAELKDDELRCRIVAAKEALALNRTPREFADSQDWHKGVSGYVNQTVPAALYCWAYSPNDFRQCVENAVMLGGDTDTVGAIAGAVCGANLGSGKLPGDWLDRLAEWPRGIDWMQRLAEILANADGRGKQEPPGMYWLATLPRNLVFAVVVIGIGMRRLLPSFGN